MPYLDLHLLICHLKSWAVYKGAKLIRTVALMKGRKLHLSCQHTMWETKWNYNTQKKHLHSSVPWRLCYERTRHLKFEISQSLVLANLIDKQCQLAKVKHDVMNADYHTITLYDNQDIQNCLEKLDWRLPVTCKVIEVVLLFLPLMCSSYCRNL